MSNIDFSKTAKAVMKNKPLAAFTVQKMAHLTKEEIKQGHTEIPLAGDYELVIQFGPLKKSADSVEQPKNSPPLKSTGLKDFFINLTDFTKNLFPKSTAIDTSNTNTDMLASVMMQPVHAKQVIQVENPQPKLL